MQMTKTKLHIIIVNEYRRISREILSECLLIRDGIPHIHITDNKILNMFGWHEKMPIMFYDTNEDRFNFKVSNLMDIIRTSTNDPEEIILEMLEYPDDTDVIGYIQLEPGLWKEDSNGKYRMCDDSIMHIIMDTKIIPMIKSEQIEWADGAATTLFCYLYNNLSFHYFENRNNEDDLEDDDTEDDDLIDNYCQMCCDNFDHEKDVCTCDKDCAKCEYPDNENICKELNDCTGKCGTCKCKCDEDDDECDIPDCCCNCNKYDHDDEECICGAECGDCDCFIHDYVEHCRSDCNKYNQEENKCTCQKCETCKVNDCKKQCRKDRIEYATEKCKTCSVCDDCHFDLCVKAKPSQTKTKKSNDNECDVEALYPKFIPVNPFYGITKTPTPKHKSRYRKHSHR